MKTQLAVGVRELVEHVLRSGDLVMEFSGSSRAAEAVRIHQRIQYSRPDGYVPEVSVSRRIETEDFVLEIGGRIDGVFAGPGTPVVEEIKTTRRSLEESVRSDNPLHWGQAKAYAFLYGVDRGIGDIEVQLTYARLDTGATREVRRRFTLAELAAFFDELVARYLKWASVITQWRRARDTSLGDLSFPYATYRSGQENMAETVDRTIRVAGRMFIQAATGIGKTMAVLFPAVKDHRRWRQRQDLLSHGPHHRPAGGRKGPGGVAHPRTASEKPDVDRQGEDLLHAERGLQPRGV